MSVFSIDSALADRAFFCLILIVLLEGPVPSVIQKSYSVLVDSASVVSHHFIYLFGLAQSFVLMLLIDLH